jgi:class 3 adenylate cyclase
MKLNSLFNSHFFLFWFFLFVQNSSSAFDKILILQDSQSSYPVGLYDYYFREPDEHLSIEQIVSGKYDHLFELSKTEAMNFGNQEATYWNRFTIYNASSSKTKWLLMLDEHHLDSLEFYYPDQNGRYNLIRSGRSTPYTDRMYDHNNYVLELPLLSGDTATFFLKVNSHLIIYPLKIIKYEQFVEDSMKRNIAKGIIIGLFLMIILYNFFIYLTVNDKNYLYYTAYAFWNIIMICDLTGYADVLWQGPLRFMWDKTPAIIAIDGILLMLFSKHILEFDKNFPFADKVIHYILIPIACWTITANIIGWKLYASITNQFWVLLLVVFLYVAAIIVYRRGYLPARFYIIACGAFFIACGTYAATLLGFIPVNTFTNHVIEIGSGIEMLLFSFALADKIRQFRKDKSAAQAQLVNTLKENEELILDQNRNLELKVAERTKDIKLEKEKSENLLLNILPENVADELKEKGYSEARQFENASIMFIEFVDFTKVSEGLSPNELVSEIDKCFKAFDHIIYKYGLEKIKTFGGTYMAVSGIPAEDVDSAANIVKASLEIKDFMNTYKMQGGIFEVKTGIHCGPVVGGIVGTKKFAFDIWGDVVNTAARMEQHSLPGKINVSGTMFNKINNEFECVYRGKIQAKNKGEVDMYFIEDFKIHEN